jgi:hypothetical protein
LPALISFLTWGINRIRIRTSVNTSVIGKASHIPSSWKNRGSIKMAGIRKKTDLALEDTMDWNT